MTKNLWKVSNTLIFKTDISLITYLELAVKKLIIQTSMHSNWRPQTNVSNIPLSPQNTYFSATSCIYQLITWLQN